MKLQETCKAKSSGYLTHAGVNDKRYGVIWCGKMKTEREGLSAGGFRKKEKLPPACYSKSSKTKALLPIKAYQTPGEDNRKLKF
jgi:hypothetical protein